MIQYRGNRESASDSLDLPQTDEPFLGVECIHPLNFQCGSSRRDSLLHLVQPEAAPTTRQWRNKQSESASSRAAMYQSETIDQ